MNNLNWSELLPLQIGRYAEYFAKMEFTRQGFDVYTAEVDDKGIDFVLRKEIEGKGVKYYDVQVKSVRGANSIFFPKKKFKLSDNLLAVILIFYNDKMPEMYIIPSKAWEKPDALLVSRDYGEGKKSPPEWGVNISQKNQGLLDEYAFEKVVRTL